MSLLDIGPRLAHAYHPDADRLRGSPGSLIGTPPPVRGQLTNTSSSDGPKV